MKRNIIIWIIVLALIVLQNIGVWLEENSTEWNPNDYARITNMDYKAVVVDEPGSSGKIVVTERLTFDVHAASYDNLFWELWRDLCESYIDGLRVHYKVNSVKQILSNGKTVDWEESPKLYWYDSDYISSNTQYGPGKWFHSEGPYNESRRQYECLLFYVDGLYREVVEFEIEYEMYNAVLRYGDCSDLYISMYSGDTIKHLKSLNAEILIPNKDMPKQGNYSVTTYGTNSNDFPVQESSNKNQGYYTFSFSLDEDDLKFRPYNEYIEFDLVAYGDDKHIFAENASKNDYYNDNVLDEIKATQAEYAAQPAKYKTIKIYVFAGCLLVAAIAIVLSKNKINEIKRKYPSISTEIPCATYRDIPSDLDPKFAAALVAFKHKKKEDDASVYSAILLSLARKQYIELKETSSSDITIKLTNQENGNSKFDSIDTVEPKEQLEPLTPSEMHYFLLLKRHAIHGSITMSALQTRISTDYDYTNNFVKNMKRVVVDCGMRLKYLYKSDYLEPQRNLASCAKTSFIVGIIALLVNIITYRTRIDLAFGGFFMLGAILFALGIYLKTQSYKYVLLTEEGEREYKKWRGLYNFFKSDTLLNERTVIELPLWEKYLVYSTAFGISEKVIAAIKIRCPDVLEQPKSIVNSNYCRSGRIRTSGIRFHASVRSGYSRRAPSSYGSSYSGGGFSGSYRGGGGRGGGGGGGGH